MLSKLGFEKTNSSANFVFVKHPDFNGYDLYKTLKEKGILVRNFNKPRIKDYLRITIGTKDQMDILISTLNEIIL